MRFIAIRIWALMAYFASFLGLAALATPAVAQVDNTTTAGGLRIGARIMHVTTLEDGGPGSLRQAIVSPGARIIVFDVAGYIELRSNLTIVSGNLTIAGQSAPSPGIVLRGGTVQIRASDVEIENIAVYAGQGPAGASDERDALNVYGKVSKGEYLQRIVLRNVSLGWGVDENLSLNGLVDGVRIESSLLSEGLKFGGHSKGLHSMNLLLGTEVKRVLLLGNIMADANQRNPRLTNGNQVSMLNNLIYNFGARATHLDLNKEAKGAARIDIIGNSYIRGRDSNCKAPIVTLGRGFFDSEPPSHVFMADNQELGADSCKRAPASEGGDRLEAQPLQAVPGWTILRGKDVYPSILQRAGSRPADRNPIDARILRDIAEGKGLIPDVEEQVGGWPAIDRNFHPAEIGFSLIQTDDELRAVRSMLCRMRKSVGASGSSC